MDFNPSAFHSAFPSVHLSPCLFLPALNSVTNSSIENKKLAHVTINRLSILEVKDSDVKVTMPHNAEIEICRNF